MFPATDLQLLQVWETVESEKLRDGLVGQLRAAAEEEAGKGRAVEEQEEDGGLGTSAADLQLRQTLEGREESLQLSI